MTRNLVDKRVKRTKQSFKQALLSLLAVKHYDEITITDIVKQADFNRGTFYIHYEQKDDLLRDLMDEMLKEMLKSFRETYKGMVRKEVQIIELSTFPIFDHFTKNKEFYQLMLGPNINYNFQEKMIKMMRDHFKEDIDFTINHLLPDIDIELFLSYRAYGIMGIILEWIHNNFNHSVEYMAEQVVKIATFHTEKVLIKIKI